MFLETETGAPAKVAPESKMLRAALVYATKYRWSVLPCCERGKTPITAHGVKDASGDPSVLSEWWRNFPNANIGIACGSASGGLLVLDIDGQEGEESLSRFSAQYGPLPITPQVLTGKGTQFYFQGDRAFKNRVRIAPGIDIRAEAGYVLAPPSIHPNGKTYTWEVSGRIDEVPLAPVPDWLVSLITDDPAAEKRRKHESYWRGIILSGAPEGKRNHTIAQLAGHLLRRFVDPIVVCELLLCWNYKRNKPPLPEDELLRTVDSVAGIEARRRNNTQ